MSLQAASKLCLSSVRAIAGLRGAATQGFAATQGGQRGLPIL